MATVTKSSNFRFQIPETISTVSRHLDFRFQIPNFNFQISVSRLTTIVAEASIQTIRFQISDWHDNGHQVIKFHIPDSRDHINGLRSSRFQISDSKLQFSDFSFQIDHDCGRQVIRFQISDWHGNGHQVITFQIPDSRDHISGHLAFRFQIPSWAWQ